MKLRMLAAAALVAAVGVVVVAIPTAAGGAAGNRLFAYVVATNRGPVPACSDACIPLNGVNEFIYVLNGNSAAALTGMRLGTGRNTVPNSFVVSSIDSHIYVNGVDTFDFVDTPPPGSNNGQFFTGFSGRWPSTVTCPAAGPPCAVIGNPAVLPGEVASVLYYGWAHGATEPNGSYVFRFTIHGTFNGTPTDLSATSAPITMTP